MRLILICMALTGVPPAPALLMSGVGQTGAFADSPNGADGPAGFSVHKRAFGKGRLT